ncbi:MAG: sensor histidine kinase [Solirubrobacteraceae bacterium]
MRYVDPRRSVDWRTLATAGLTGLEQTLFAPPATRPWRSAWLRRLASLAAIAGGLVVANETLLLTRPYTDDAPRIVLFGLLGLLLAAPRFPLIAWRLGLLAAVLIPLTVEPAGVDGGQFAALVVLFWAAALTAERTVLWWMCALTVALSWLWLPLGGRPEGTAVATLITVALAVAVDAAHGRRRARQELAVEAAHVEREQAHRAVLEERARIARELHDVVAHHMSLIAVQAETARYRINEVPEVVSAEFGAISNAARNALSDMRRLLGVLRNDEAAARAPQPQIEQIPELIDTARNAGVPVHYSLDGTVDAIPSAVGVCAYRIVQEALSNATRHARGASVSVQVQRDRDAVRLTITNGPGRALAPVREDQGPGHGLAGMRERADLLGGTLTAGPVRAGGFSVSAVLPFTDTS